MIDGRSFFNQPVLNDEITYNNIPKIIYGQGDDYTTSLFQKHKTISIISGKQQKLDANSKVMQKINFTGNLIEQLIRRITRGGEGEARSPCPFSKIGKGCPNFGKKCPDCVHLGLNFSF